MIHLIGLAVVALGVAFFVLRIKKRLYWIGACRCRAQVSRADYRIVRDEQGDIESQNSSAAVTMAFACRGTSYTVKKSFDKALDAPRTGEWLKIFYRPDTDEWIFCREVRPWWTLQLLSGAVFVTVGAVVACGGCGAGMGFPGTAKRFHHGAAKSRQHHDLFGGDLFLFPV